jgi:hypothetical protein
MVDRCEPACGSGGTCVPDTSNSTTARGTCQCQPGWGGVSCDECADGHWGAECQGMPFIFLSIEALISACTGDCTQCDDGLTGTGTCLGTTTDSVKGESVVPPRADGRM